MKRKAVNWLELPSHLEEQISDKLTCIKDFIRFGAVCHSWRSIYNQNRHRLHRHQHPVLMLHVENRSHPPSYNYYDLSNKKFLNFPSQPGPPSNSRCIGSSQGWLVYQLNLQVFLLNPFLSVNNKIDLPSLKGGPFDTLDRPVLSADPASNPGYMVLASYICCDSSPVTYRLVLYKSGDNAWRAIPLDRDCRIDDVVYCRERFYVLRSNEVLICDVSSCDDPRPKVLAVEENEVSQYKMMYLVGSSGDLWGVTRIWHPIFSDDFFASPTAGFEVFKLDENAFKWVQTKNLGGMSLFVGFNNASMSLVASEFPGCKPNCIYFTQHIYHPDMGVYNLKDGSFEPYYPVESSKLVDDIPTWVEPTLGCLV